MDSTGRVAIVTGAGQGLGRAYALELARRGTAVVVNDARAGATDAVVDEIRALGGRALGVEAPVGPSSTATLLVDAAVREFGRLDALVANAGVLRDTVLWKMTDEDFDLVIDVHLRGTFTCVREAVILMREQGEGGRIVCIGSTTGQLGNFGQSNYAAAKAGVVGMVRSWALELERSGIGVNAVIPIAATAMTETVPYFRDWVEDAAAGRPLPPFARRVLGFGTPSDVAGLVAYLASEESAGITGQALGAGGDRLVVWAHPHEEAIALHSGGWSADEVAAQRDTLLRPHLQPLGPVLPEPPSSGGAA